MWRVGPYVYKHVNNNYYVRVRVPKDLLPIATCREFKLAVGPTEKDKLCAMYLGACATSMFREHLKLRKQKENMEFLDTPPGLVPTPSIITTFESEHQKYAFIDFVNSLKRVVPSFNSAPSTGLVDYPRTQPATRGASPALSPVAVLNAGHHSLSHLIEAFLTHKKNSGDCNPESLKKTLGYCTVLQEILLEHDHPIDRPAQLTPAYADFVFGMLNRYPQSRTKSTKFKDEPLDIAMRIARENERLSPVTVSKYLECYRALFKFAIGQCEYGVAQNPFNDKKVSKKAIKKSSSSRDTFSKEDIKAVFSGEIYSKGKYTRAFEYWVLPILYTTGCRREEVAQLRCRDIKLHNGVWVIAHEDDHEKKRFKTTASERLVPLHQRLIELGLLQYRDRIVAKLGEDARLFPELTYQGPKHGFGRNIARHLLGEGAKKGYLYKVGVKKEAKDLKDLHAFRHTVVTMLQEVGVSRELREAIAGHEGDSNSVNKIYSHADLVPQMKEAIDKMQLSRTFLEMKPFDFELVKRKLPRHARD